MILKYNGEIMLRFEGGFKIGDVVTITKKNSKHYGKFAKVIRLIEYAVGPQRVALNFGKKGRPPIYKETELELVYRVNND